MKESEQFARARLIMTRVVSEKIPQADRWSVPREFKSWIDGLADEAFRAYIDRLSKLTRNLSDEETPQEVGVFVAGKSYPLQEMEIKRHLDLIGGEATAYYALALWRTLEAERLVRQLSGNESNQRP
jgi:hypothetical protein